MKHHKIKYRPALEAKDIHKKQHYMLLKNSFEIIFRPFLPNFTLEDFLNFESIKNGVMGDSLEVQKELASQIMQNMQAIITNQNIEHSPENAEKAFLLNMKRFRMVGNKNIYGNSCTVFEPPSGYAFNEEVSNTYYDMYTSALSGSNALALLETVVEDSLEYAIGGGELDMYKWMIDVGVPAIAAEIGFVIKQKTPDQSDSYDNLDPTLTYLTNQNYQSALAVAYVFG